MNLKNKLFKLIGVEPLEGSEIAIRLNLVDKEYEKINSIKKGLIKANHGGKTAIKLSKKALLEFPLMEWVSLGYGVMSRRRNKHFEDSEQPESEIWNFDTRMIKDAEFGRHFHPDMVESCEAVVGSFVDEFNGRIYNEGEVAIFPKDEIHEVRALEDCLLRVLFRLS